MGADFTRRTNAALGRTRVRIALLKINDDAIVSHELIDRWHESWRTRNTVATSTSIMHKKHKQTNISQACGEQGASKAQGRETGSKRGARNWERGMWKPEDGKRGNARGCSPFATNFQPITTKLGTDTFMF